MMASLSLENFYQCKKCDILFTDEKIFENHMHTKHPDRSVSKKFRCGFCTYSSDIKRDVQRHTRIHTKEKPFECSVCFKKFNQKGHLGRHMRIHGQESPFRCHICGKTYKISSCLKQHIRITHEKSKPCMCRVCGFTATYAVDIQRHMSLEHKRRQYNCRYCNEKFLKPSDVLKHERSHIIIG